MGAKVVLLRPGDVYMFCGGVTHATLCVSEQMSLSSYESMVSLHPIHVEHLLRTTAREGPYPDLGCMPKDEFKDLLMDILDQFEEAEHQLQNGGPKETQGPWSHV